MVNSDTDDIKVGSTTRDLGIRMSQHRSESKKKGGYDKMNEIGIDKFTIELIELYPCDNVDELRKREQYYIDLLKPTLNMQKAYANNAQKEAQERFNKSFKRKQYEAEYFQKNKEKLYAQRKKFAEENSEFVKERQAKNFQRWYQAQKVLKKK